MMTGMSERQMGDHAGHASSAERSPGQASNLVIRIVVQGDERVRVSLPWHRVEAMESLIDPATLEKIRERGVSIPSIIVGSRLKGHPPGILFSAEDGGRICEVRLV